MAILSTPDGRQTTDPPTIQEILRPIGVRLEKWEIPESPHAERLLLMDRLSPDESERLLECFDDRFRLLKSSLGYQTRDLIVLYKDLPGLDGLLLKFISCHTHDDDEIRYVVEGEGIFGFVLPSGDQVELTVQAGDYIHVPRGAEHWFRLTSSKRIKAIRYFTSREGWVPNYTGRAVQAFPDASIQ